MKNKNAPIVTFALPRSGSTLFMRLLNRSKCSLTGNPVRYNGEFDALEQILYIAKELLEQDGPDQDREMGVNELKEDIEFLSHYHRQKTIEAHTHIADLMPNYCGYDGGPWGWKSVNYGVLNGPWFMQLCNNLSRLYPRVRFIFLRRDIADVAKSMLTFEFFGNNPVHIDQRLRNQTTNYRLAQTKHKDKSYSLEFNEVLNYEAFTKFLAKLDLQIDKPDYDAVTGKIIKGDPASVMQEKQLLNQA